MKLFHYNSMLPLMMIRKSCRKSTSPAFCVQFFAKEISLSNVHERNKQHNVEQWEVSSFVLENNY